MIPFTLAPEPATFEQRCRQRGRRWLQKNRTYQRPEDYWSEFCPALHEAFTGLCGYSAMYIQNGEVDHFIPIAIGKRRRQPELAYEWSNFRYADGIMNQKKGSRLVLDPFVVQDGWFEVLLPSLQLVPTAQIPARYRRVVAATLEALALTNGEVVVRARRAWFAEYQAQNLTLDGLRRFAPLVAQAVQRDLLIGKDWRLGRASAAGQA